MTDMATVGNALIYGIPLALTTVGALTVRAHGVDGVLAHIAATTWAWAHAYRAGVIAFTQEYRLVRDKTLEAWAQEASR
jgi:hypothetical protein